VARFGDKLVAQRYTGKKDRKEEPGYQRKSAERVKITSEANMPAFRSVDAPVVFTSSGVVDRTTFMQANRMMPSTGRMP
jgi:hypothetical protein